MATATHRALDGSRVTFTADGDVDLSRPMTSSGFVAVPGVRSPHPFNVSAGSRWEQLATIVAADHPEIEYRVLGEERLKGGVLRSAHVRRPVATGGTRQYVFGSWEGGRASLATSVYGRRADLVSLYRSMRFAAIDDGVAVRSPIDETIRPRRSLKHVPGVGAVEVSPLSRAVRKTLPARSGQRAAGGELYADSARGRYLMLVTGSCAVRLPTGSRPERSLELAEALTVEWEQM